jgi:hypothetical protein
MKSNVISYMCLLIVFFKVLYAPFQTFNITFIILLHLNPPWLSPFVPNWLDTIPVPIKCYQIRYNDSVTLPVKIVKTVMFYTRKISHLVASVSTSRQQVVFALLVPSCQQIWSKLLTSLFSLSDLLQGCSIDIISMGCFNKSDTVMSHDITILLKPCFVNLVTFLLYHDCIGLVRTTM